MCEWLTKNPEQTRLSTSIKGWQDTIVKLLLVKFDQSEIYEELLTKVIEVIFQISWKGSTTNQKAHKARVTNLTIQTRIWIIGQNFDFSQNVAFQLEFPLLALIQIFGQKFYFQISIFVLSVGTTRISIFGHNFCPKFGFLSKIWVWSKIGIFDQNFDIQSSDF